MTDYIKVKGFDVKAATDRVEVVKEAIEVLNKVNELEPVDIAGETRGAYNAAFMALNEIIRCEKKNISITL